MYYCCAWCVNLWISSFPSRQYTFSTHSRSDISWSYWLEPCLEVDFKGSQAWHDLPSSVPFPLAQGFIGSCFSLMHNHGIPSATSASSVGVVFVVAIRKFPWSEFSWSLVSTFYAPAHRMSAAYKRLGNKTILWGHKPTLELKRIALKLVKMQFLCDMPSRKVVNWKLYSITVRRMLKWRYCVGSGTANNECSYRDIALANRN